MSGSSLQEGFLIDSRRLQVFSRSWEKKGSSVRKEVWFVYGRNSPVMFHIVSCSEEQLKSFTLSRRWRFCAVATAIVQKHHLQGMGAYPGGGLQTPRKAPAPSGKYLCFTIRCCLGFFRFFTAQDLFQPVAAALSEWWSLAKSEQCQILCFTITSAEVNEHCQESTVNTVFRY